jgi:phosphoglycolate phosphatase-like HAD superfamily hydrolase
MTVRAFLFDVDSTLVHTGGAGARALAAAIEACVGIRDAMAGVRLHGRTDRAILREVLGRGRAGDGSPPDTAATSDAPHTAQPPLDRIFDDYVLRLEREVAVASAYRVLPGVETLLRALEARGAILGLATGNHSLGARIKITRGGLDPYFSFGGFGDEHEDRGELVLAAKRRAEARAGRSLDGEVVVVGDSELDVYAAHHAGCVAVGVCTGHTRADELRDAGADFVLDDLVGAESRAPFL